MLKRPTYKLVSLRIHILAICLLALLASTGSAQYLQLNVVCNRRASGLRGIHVDPNLINPWGLAFFPSSPFWVSDQGTGLSTLYRHFGRIVPLVVKIPAVSGATAHGPTGIVAANVTGQF